MATVNDKLTLSGGFVFPSAAVTNVNDTTPTLAELTTACPNMSAGEFRIVNDNNGNTNFFIVASSDGTTRFFTKMTKAA